MQFDYYYGTQADQFSFIKIPRVMVNDEKFSKLSLQSKILYSILLDRMTLSRKNGWFDEDNKVYIIYPINEIIEDLGFSRKKAMDYLMELEVFGLVEKKKRGFGLPSIIYVKSFLSQNDSRSVDLVTTGNSIKSKDIRSADVGTSRDVDTGTSEVPKAIPLNNKTYMNNTDESKKKSNHILSDPDAMGCDENENMTIEAYDQIIRENIEYDILLSSYPMDTEIIEGILELILEVMISESHSILIASEKYPAALVKSKFMKLNMMHVEYVLECLRKNTSKVRNIKKYLLASLFNAPSTISGYYKAEVNHDMPQFAG